MSSTEIIEMLDIPKATVSRNLRMLGDRLSPNKEGLKLITMEHDPMDYRVRRAYLTDLGKEFLRDITEALK